MRSKFCRSHLGLRSLAFGLIAVLAGCATEPVSLDARLATTHIAKKITRPVGFIHGAEFRSKTMTVSVATTVKLGEAGDRIFREAYAARFASVVEFPSRAALSSVASDIGVIEPTLADTHSMALNPNIGYRAAEVTYRFTMTEPGGRKIAAWTIRGFGEFRDENRLANCKEDVAVCLDREAPKRAIEAAGLGLVNSIDRVPELVRWARAMPLEGSEASAALQQTNLVTPDGWVTASYPGVLVLRARREKLPAPASKPERGDAARIPPVVPFHFELRNESSRLLLLDPSQIQWHIRDDVADPVPPRVAAATVLGPTVLLPPGPAGTGVAALPNLFMALANASTLVQAKKDLSAMSELFVKNALGECLLVNATCQGSLYFLVAPELQGGELIVPVIDLEAVVRYVVRLPLPGG